MSNYGAKRIDSVFDVIQIGNVLKIVQHYENKDTFVFQMKGKKYALNGCQLVEEKDLPKVCVGFCLSAEQRSSLRQCIAILDQDINKDEIIELLQKELFEAFLQGLINEELIDEDLAVVAIRKNKNLYYTLFQSVLITQKMRVALVEKDGLSITDIPKKLRNLEICKAAFESLKSDFKSVNYVEEKANSFAKEMLKGYIPNYIWNEHFEDL